MKKRLLAAIAAAITFAFAAQAQVTTDSLVNIQRARHYTELWGQRAALYNTLGVDSTNIVMFGNSLTHGGEWNELMGRTDIVNRGINGDIIQGLVDRLDAVVDGHPRKIFLLIGVNDVSHNLTADSIVTATCGMIDKIMERTPTTRLYVQSLFPINNSFKRYKAIFGKEDVIRQINAKLRPEVEKRGLKWVEVNSFLVDDEGNLRSDLTNDGLHLLPEGYAIWRDILAPLMAEE